jgi:hypothetical protein
MCRETAAAAKRDCSARALRDWAKEEKKNQTQEEK